MILLFIGLVLAVKAAHHMSEPIAKKRFKPDMKFEDQHKIWSEPPKGKGTNRALQAHIVGLNRQVKQLEAENDALRRSLHRTQAHLDELHQSIQDITGSVHFINCTHPHCEYYAAEIGKMQAEADALAGAASAAS